MAIAGCVTSPTDDGDVSGDTDNETVTPTPTPSEDETRTPPPTDSEGLNDVRLNSRRNESIAGAIRIDTSDETKELEFDLEPFEDRSWEEVSVLRNDALVTTEVNGEQETYEWSGSRENGLVIFVWDDEIENRTIVS